MRFVLAYWDLIINCSLSPNNILMLTVIVDSILMLIIKLIIILKTHPMFVFILWSIKHVSLLKQIWVSPSAVEKMGKILIPVWQWSDFCGYFPMTFSLTLIDITLCWYNKPQFKNLFLSNICLFFLFLCLW